MVEQKNWLTERIHHLHSSTDATVAIVVSKSELKDLTLLGLLATSKDFIQDLNMTNSYWFYEPTSMKRCLLLQYAPKQDAKPIEQKSTMKSLANKAVTELQAKKCSNVEVLIASSINDQELLGIFLHSFYLTNYEYSFKTQPKKEPKEQLEDYDPREEKYRKKIDQWVIRGGEKGDNLLETEELKFWMVAAKATEYCRDLANTRATIADPDYMETKVRELVKDQPNVASLRVVTGPQLTELGMNLLFAVGKGAVSQPRCIAVQYKGNPDSDETDIAFVGKGITFDTGGLNLKSTGNIESMFLDKGGACVVLGALKGTLELGLKKNVVFAMGLAENSIDNMSYKPLDIITAMNGLTVEIDNTDAEGRLILADTFTYV